MMANGSTGFKHNIQIIFSSAMLKNMCYDPKYEGFGCSIRSARSRLFEFIFEKIEDILPKNIQEKHHIFLDFCLVGLKGTVTHCSEKVSKICQAVDVMKSHMYDSFVKSLTCKITSDRYGWDSKAFEKYLLTHLIFGGIQIRLAHGFFLDEKSNHVATTEDEFSSVAQKMGAFRTQLVKDGYKL